MELNLTEQNSTLLSNLLDPSILITILSLVATILGLIYQATKKRDDAFNEYRRCHRLTRVVVDKYRRLYDKMVDITLCLTNKEDKHYIEDLLFKYSNILAELIEFGENECPKIHLDINKIVRNYTIAGGLYMILGVGLILSGPKTLDQVIFAIIYGMIGLFIIHETQPKATEKIEKYKLVLDNIEDNLKILEENLQRLEDKCPSEQASKG